MILTTQQLKENAMIILTLLQKLIEILNKRNYSHL